MFVTNKQTSQEEQDISSSQGRRPSESISEEGQARPATTNKGVRCKQRYTVKGISVVNHQTIIKTLWSGAKLLLRHQILKVPTLDSL